MNRAFDIQVFKRHKDCKGTYTRNHAFKDLAEFLLHIVAFQPSHYIVTGFIGTAFMGRTQKAELFPQVDMRNLLLVIGFCLADDFSCLNRNIRFIGFNQNLRHVFPAP